MFLSPTTISPPLPKKIWKMLWFEKQIQPKIMSKSKVRTEKNHKKLKFVNFISRPRNSEQFLNPTSTQKMTIAGAVSH